MIEKPQKMDAKQSYQITIKAPHLTDMVLIVLIR